MENQNKTSFTKRPAGHPISISGHQTPGQVRRAVVITGDRVSLCIESEIILVNDVEVISNGQYRGRIDGFEPSVGLEYAGHKLEDIVTFEERHIWWLHLP